MNKWLKKSILLVGLALITAGPALADGDEEASGGEFSFGTDVVSRYIWRGIDFGDGLSLQPYMAYTNGPIEIGTWSSWGVTSNGANENDLYVTYSIGPVGITVTDYFFPKYPLQSFQVDNDGDGLVNEDPVDKEDNDKDEKIDEDPVEAPRDTFLDYSDTGGHTIELMVSLAQGPISLLGAINILETKDDAGNTQNTLYVEAGYDLGEINEVAVSLVAGLGNEDLTTDTDLNLINAGINLSKDNYWASYLVNLDRETSYLVFGWTFF
jgi:hypothetical protein